MNSKAAILLLIILACVAGCGGESSPPGGGAPVMLPDAYYGAWETRRSGAAGRPFNVQRGKTIFSGEPQWMVAFEHGGEALVMQLAPDGTLTTSENVYDGFSVSYRRGKLGP